MKVNSILNFETISIIIKWKKLYPEEVEVVVESPDKNLFLGKFKTDEGTQIRILDLGR
ncbi:MAG: hypothetical protein R2879_05370 [Saprospiraceae bacterium]